jgi:hypothetical protein
MSWHIDDVVSKLTAMIQDGSGQEQIDMFLSNIRPEHRDEVLQLARAKARKSNEHEGATENEVGDTTGSGAGYDTDPKKVADKGGVS